MFPCSFFLPCSLFDVLASQGENTDFHPDRAPHRDCNNRNSCGDASSGSARQKAKEIACTSNLKQMGVMYGMYGGDYKDYLPQVPENATFSFYTREIISISTVPEWGSYGKFYPAGYVKTGRVFYCPLNDGKNVIGDYYGNAGAWSWINFLNNGGKPETVKSNVAGGICSVP